MTDALDLARRLVNGLREQEQQTDRYHLARPEVASADDAALWLTEDRHRGWRGVRDLPTLQSTALRLLFQRYRCRGTFVARGGR